MTTPTISVALCTHNGARYVREQVESILRQSRPADEIVLSDDASTDGTVEIVIAAVESWPAPRPVLTVLRNSPALGVVANFEQATAACTGDLIALCDQDDVWHDDKLVRFDELFAAQPALPLAHSDAALVTGDLVPLPDSLLVSLEATARERSELVDGRSYAAFLRRNLVTGATAVFRASLLGPARPFPAEWVHDEWLAVIAAALDRTHLIADELVDYRQHGGNQIGAVKPTLRYKIGKLLEPRTDRNERLVERARVLVDRLEALPVAPARLELARRKLAHERFRNGLPRVRVLRLPGVAAAVLAGRYGRYSRGIPDAVRDLVQPAR
jgi:glycosyltransferase involved in cell wall biosynthesis